MPSKLPKYPGPVGERSPKVYRAEKRAKAKIMKKGRQKAARIHAIATREGYDPLSIIGEPRAFPGDKVTVEEHGRGR